MTVDHELNLQALKYELENVKRRILVSVSDLRYLCDLVESAVNGDHGVNRSSTTAATELFCAVGQYDCMRDIVAMLEGKK